jgi:hypothetical protein
MQGYREDDGLFLESDTDEQLLIHIPFNQKVGASKVAATPVDDSGGEGSLLWGQDILLIPA